MPIIPDDTEAARLSKLVEELPPQLREVADSLLLYMADNSKRIQTLETFVAKVRDTAPDEKKYWFSSEELALFELGQEAAILLAELNRKPTSPL